MRSRAASRSQKTRIVSINVENKELDRTNTSLKKSNGNGTSEKVTHTPDTPSRGTRIVQASFNIAAELAFPVGTQVRGYRDYSPLSAQAERLALSRRGHTWTTDID